MPPTFWHDFIPPYNKLDAHTVSGDAVSRAAAFSLESESAEILDTTGLVTMFQFDPIPVLTNQFENQTLTLTWSASPHPFRLQWAGRVGDPSGWSDYPGPIGGNAGFREVKIGAGTLQSSRFFRLFWNSPQPGLGQALPARPEAERHRENK